MAKIIKETVHSCRQCVFAILTDSGVVCDKQKDYINIDYADIHKNCPLPDKKDKKEKVKPKYLLTYVNPLREVKVNFNAKHEEMEVKLLFTSSGDVSGITDDMIERKIINRLNIIEFK
jgi:hypothetical protein